MYLYLGSGINLRVRSFKTSVDKPEAICITGYSMRGEEKAGIKILPNFSHTGIFLPEVLLQLQGGMWKDSGAV